MLGTITPSICRFGDCLVTAAGDPRGPGEPSPPLPSAKRYIFVAIDLWNETHLAEKFYTQLFDREPDDRPMKGLIQWRNVAGANIQLFHDKENAGSGRLTIVVPKMDEARRSLEAIGVKLTGESQGDYGRIARFADPDGNRITLAEPPSRPFDRYTLKCATRDKFGERPNACGGSQGGRGRVASRRAASWLPGSKHFAI